MTSSALFGAERKAGWPNGICRTQTCFYLFTFTRAPADPTALFLSNLRLRDDLTKWSRASGAAFTISALHFFLSYSTTQLIQAPFLRLFPTANCCHWIKALLRKSWAIIVRRSQTSKFKTKKALAYFFFYFLLLAQHETPNGVSSLPYRYEVIAHFREFSRRN